MRGTLLDDNGTALGPLLPTQLVCVKAHDGSAAQVVTAVEALGLAELPTGDVFSNLLKEHIRLGMYVLAGLQLGKALGPGIAEGLAEGGGAKAIVGAVGRAAASEAGTAALTNAALLVAIDVVEQHRDAFAKSAAGREFLELFDTVMMLWVARDVSRLVATGVLPRIVKSFDWAMTQGLALRDGLMSMRAELEALRRAAARYGSTAEAAEAATVGGGTAGLPAETQPGFFQVLRVTRGEVAAENLAAKTANTAAAPSAKRVLGRLGSAVERAEAAAASAAPGEQQAADAALERASRARLHVAQRANQLRPDARETFLAAVDPAISKRPNSLDAIADLLSAAARSPRPNLYMAEVATLLDRGAALSDEALRTLGAKAVQGAEKLDLAWLNRTSISDEALDFLGRDKRTDWDLYRRAAADPSSEKTIKAFRVSARGAGAEMVAEREAAKLGTDIRRQVPMGDSEIDYDLIVDGVRRGFEVKGFTKKTWREALTLAARRSKRGAAPLTADELEVVKKIDRMIKQLKDIQATTGRPPLLGITSDVPEAMKDQINLLLTKADIPNVRFVTLSETEIKEAAAGTIGEALGIPRPQ